MSYFIQIKMRNFDGAGDIIFQMNGADKDIVRWVIDTYGRPSFEIKEGSCVAIIDIPFTMSMEEDFINRIEELSHERERMIYKGVL